jgi:hypothetical protein
MSNFPYDKQVKIVVASMALYNFIRKHAIQDAEFQPYDDDDDLLPTDSLSDNKNKMSQANNNQIHQMKIL